FCKGGPPRKVGPRNQGVLGMRFPDHLKNRVSPYPMSRSSCLLLRGSLSLLWSSLPPIGYAALFQTRPYFVPHRFFYLLIDGWSLYGGPDHRFLNGNLAGRRSGGSICVAPVPDSIKDSGQSDRVSLACTARRGVLHIEWAHRRLGMA